MTQTHRASLLIIAGCLLFAGPALAHDLFLKLESWFLAPNTKASVDLFNGTFGRSDNVITRDRMLDVSIVGPGPRDVLHPPEDRWTEVDNRTRLGFETGSPGTYALGVSTAPRDLEMTAEAFDKYLAHDGVVDVLAERRAAGASDAPVRERYSKHVKAVVQVGDTWSTGGEVALGYPVEIVPMANPYGQTVGGSLAVRVLLAGKPLGNQPIQASPAGHHAHDEDGNHVPLFRSRTNGNGIAVIPLSQPGPWFVRLIHMVPSDEVGLDYVSNWATLTFEVAGRESWERMAAENGLGTSSGPTSFAWAIPLVATLLVAFLVTRSRR